MLKVFLPYGFGVFLTLFVSLVEAIEPGTLTPATPDYQLPKLPKWSAIPPVNNLQLDNSAQISEVINNDIRFILKALQFSGNKTINTEQLQAIVQPYINKVVDRLDLEQIRQQLVNHYRNAGFLYPSVILPSQHISKGLVRYQIDEGQLTAINISGTEHLNEEYVRQRIALDADQPLQKDALLERFQMLLSDPLIERVNGALKPGVNPGDTILDLYITRAKAYEIQLGIDNYTPPSVGAYNGDLTGIVRNLTGWGDFLQVNLNGGEGHQGISGFFSIPVNRYDTRFNIAFQASQAKVIEGALEALDIESHFMDFNVAISQPVFRTLNRIFNVELQYAFRQTRTSILGFPIALADGVEENGKAKVSVLRFIQSYTDRNEKRVYTARSSFNTGFDAFNTTINPHPEADGRYFSWQGQLRYLHKLDERGSELFFRSDIQLTSEKLLPLERFALGGIYTVRGYREYELVRDAGYALSLELRYPIWQMSKKQQHLQIIPFFDFGQAWNLHQKQKTLYSAGIGLKWHWQQIGAEFYWAQTLNNPDTIDQEYDLQDSGIHFQLQAQLF